MRAVACVLLLAIAVPAAAQEEEIRAANLPTELERELLGMYDGAAERYDGPAVIGAAEVVRGDVAVVGGPFRIEGRVEGSVAMVNGDVVIGPDGAVTGDVIVIGGEARMEEGAEVAGTITAYALSRYARDRGDRRGRGDDDDWQSDYYDRGYSRLNLRIGSGYNRVEGLPIQFGPVIRTAGPHPLRLEALAIWRSEGGASFDTDRMGYRLEAEQLLGGRFTVGASLFSVIDPMDRWQISDLEASLAAVLFHDDYRDHSDRQGWSVFATAEPVRGLEARVAYRDEEHTSAAAADPWSLFNGDDLWRRQPVIGEGDLQLVTGSLEADFRDDDRDPREGWLARASIDRAVGGSLTRPELQFVIPQDAAPAVIPAADLDTDFTAGLVDVRRYMPVGWGSQVNVRLAAGGSLSEQSLPAQMQHALGGLGTLPGYDPFYADCGARVATGRYGDARFYPGYGCDRFVLGQVEYRGSLSLDFGFGDPDWDDDDDDWSWHAVDFDLEPTWVVFLDAARGWSYDGPLSPDEVTTGTLYDAGVGFLLDDLGLYVALPLSDEVEQEPRFFIRLGRRF